MPTCPYCNTPIVEEYHFCINCERQVKCVPCGGYLYKDKSKCLKCGTPLSALLTASLPMNTLSLEENQSDNSYSRKINLSFTDSAIDKVAPILSGHVPLNSPISLSTPSSRQYRNVTTSPQNTLPASQDKDTLNGVKNESEVFQEEDKAIPSINHKDDLNSPENEALNCFEKDSQGYLVSTTPDYKGKNRKEQQQRFCLLYVWAYCLIHHEPVPNKTHINHAVKQNGLYDSNYVTYFGDIANRFFIKSDGTFKLNPAGSAEINKILLEMNNPDIQGYEYWAPSRKNVSKSSKTSHSKISQEEQQSIEQWIKQQNLRIDKFDIRQLESTAQYAIFALYAITKELEVASSVKPTVAYEYLVQKYGTISIKIKNFRDTLGQKQYSKYFRRTSEKSYYLTLEAEGLARSWLDTIS